MTNSILTSTENNCDKCQNEHQDINGTANPDQSHDCRFWQTIRFAIYLLYRGRVGGWTVFFVVPVMLHVGSWRANEWMNFIINTNRNNHSTDINEWTKMRKSIGRHWNEMKSFFGANKLIGHDSWNWLSWPLWWCTGAVLIRHCLFWDAVAVTHTEKEDMQGA